ncbi:glycoside hydrolase family 32 protein [Globicatella sulfidifaciens]|uniref:Sucrose-6-phosphate hydrolase n=1 Tax=Globicatella sulfidifaciens DSM 15739 TaxID=1121925 RepID=A0A1T4P3U8_9LACT|nr:glycoside hydrolase family 32 protein [Globicatella sulfidifaciens]SJZ86071.1 beta-fructofuranosidase [Globicatella sulfidifaciens DSM 15739]
MRNQGKFAQHFHITPTEGLLNDPNGLCYFQGYYHVFYQLNPYNTNHETKYWGHLRSKDMMHWEQLPIALKSDDWFDKNGVYSGSAIVHNEQLYLFYTGNTKDDQGVRNSYQCLATSSDGINFEKHGPILEQAPGFTGHVRDPKVWWDEQLSGWWMILGAQREDLTGDTIAYFSKDLLNWDYKGSILQFEEPLGYMWECPDLIFLTDEVTGEEKAVFIFSPQGLEPVDYRYHNIFNTTYVIGKWDANRAKFIPEDWSALDLVEVDRGFEFYAPQTFTTPDGRTIQYAWMGTMWPEVEEAVPTHCDKWIHHLSMPRSLHLVDNRLVQRPIVETEALLSNEVQQVKWDGNDLIELPLANPSRIQIEGINNLTSDFNIMIDQAVHIQYKQLNQELTIERINWHTKKAETRSVLLKEGAAQLDIWLDTSSLELFINEGATTMSMRYFADKPHSKVTFQAEAISTPCDIKVTKLLAYQFS